MPTLSNKKKNKASMLEMQLPTEQRVFVVKTYYKTSSCQEVNETFRRTFSEKDPPPNRTKRENDKRYEIERTNLNIGKRRSGMRRTVTTKETMEVVKLYVENNAGYVSFRRNRLGD